MLSNTPIASTPLSSLPVIKQAGDSIEGSSTLAFTCPIAPELVFTLKAAAALSFTATASLTINIELSATATLTLAAQPAELTIGYQLSGTVTEMGIPVARDVRVYDAATGIFLDDTTSDASTGEYFIDLFGHRDTGYVQCVGSAAYGPLIHGPVTPDGR